MTADSSSPPTLSGPGIIFAMSKIIDPSALSIDTFHTWYKNVHIPDVLATGCVSSATRFKTLDPDAEYPYLVIYKVSDLGVLQSDAFKAIPHAHESLPGGKSIYEFVKFRHPFYKLTQTFEPNKGPEEFYSGIVSGAMEPAEDGHADLDAWYREEHLDQAMTQPGWRRSTRYTLIPGVKNSQGQAADDAPTYLALHEWDSEHLGEKVAPFVPVTEWTKKVCGECKKIDAFNYVRI